MAIQCLEDLRCSQGGFLKPSFGNEQNFHEHSMSVETVLDSRGSVDTNEEIRGGDLNVVTYDTFVVVGR